MKTCKITHVRIDDTGSLCIKSVEGDFTHIYRSAMGVNWSSNQHELFFPEAREWSYARCFQQIVSAVDDEYGISLVLTSSTEWQNIPDRQRREIGELPRNCR